MYQVTTPKFHKGLWIAGGLGLAYFVYRAVNNMMIRREWAQRRERKRRENAAAKTKFAQYLQKNPMVG